MEDRYKNDNKDIEDLPTLRITPIAKGFKFHNKRYTLTKKLGSGGMGVVWLAWDEELQEHIAIKMLPDIIASDPTSLHELNRETQKSRRLSHRNIVCVYDIIKDNPIAGISMEYVNGNNLDAMRLNKENRIFEVREIRDWVKQLCSALEHAHYEVKIVHRDLKPANLLVNDRNVLKVADFGIARNIAESVQKVSKIDDSSGTASYMSPQQMMGNIPTPADDIYSIGATLYDLLTGKPPFHSGEIRMQVEGKKPPTIAKRRKEFEIFAEPVPKIWDSTIAACLSKNPDDRPGSVMELAESLELTKSSHSSFPYPPLPEKKPEKDSDIASAKPKSHHLRNLLITTMVLVSGLIIILTNPKIKSYAENLFSPSQKPAEKNSILEIDSNKEEPLDFSDNEKKPIVTQNTDSTKNSVLGKSTNKKTVAIMLPGNIPLKLNLISAPVDYKFKMGSPKEENGFLPTEEFRDVEIKNDYYMGIHEITHEQYVSLAGIDNNNSAFMTADDANKLPIDKVTWSDITGNSGYIVKLNDFLLKNGITAYKVDLPDEAEWEYACRAGTTNAFNNDKPINSKLKDPNLDPLGYYNKLSSKGTKPAIVGQFQKNNWGLYDMHGNLKEWCKGIGVDTPPVLRGGSFIDPAHKCRSASRQLSDKNQRPSKDIGFRIILRPIENQ